MCSIKIQTENSRKNTNAPPTLPNSNASAFRASRGVHTKYNVVVVLPVLGSVHSLALTSERVRRAALAPPTGRLRRKSDVIGVYCLSSPVTH